MIYAKSILAVWIAVVAAAGGIHEAAEKGDLEQVRSMLEADPRLLNDTTWTQARTPLHVAIRSRHEEVARFLIERGADIGARDRAGYTVLSNAAIQGLTGIAEELIARGADVQNDASNQGLSPLHMAASRNHPDIVQLLIEHGAPVEGRHPEGVTPLHVAAMGRTEAAKALLDAGADVNAVSRAGYSPTPLLGAVRGGHRELVELLLARGANPSVGSPQGVSPLRLAIETGDSLLVEMLLTHQPDLSHRDSVSFMTPLHRGAANGLTGVCRRLLEMGADPDARDHAGRTALDLARRHGHVSTAALLRARGGAAAKEKKAFDASLLLRGKMRRGEAAVWYLGHSGWAVKTRSTLLIFDWYGYGAEPAEPGLANGRINPSEIAGLDVAVFVSHAHYDHFDRRILEWEKAGGSITYVFGWQVEGDSGRVYLPDTFETWRKDGLEVHKINSWAEPGGAFLVKVDGLTLYHGGDYLENATNAQLLERLGALQGNVDLLFVEPGYKNVALSTIRKLRPNVVFPMHARMNEPSLHPFALEAGREFPRSRFVCPETRGDRWLYSNGELR